MLNKIVSLHSPTLLLILSLVACSNSPHAPVAAPMPPVAPPSAQVSVDAPDTPAIAAIAAPVAATVPPRRPAVAAKPERPAAVPSGKPEPAVQPAPVALAEPPAPEPVAPLHDAWDKLLRKHVSVSGKVSYKGFKADKAELDAYLTALAANMPADGWSRSEKMAYWINAYNAFTIDLITDNYPVTSIMSLDGGKPWDVRRIDLGGKKYSLNQIENDILRPQFKDARIHFAVNCAARSCPPLLNRAYTGETLTSTLEQRSRQFVNDAKYNTLTGGKTQVSRIFEWYAADFGDLRAFLNRYAKVQIDADTVIGFAEYDWGLNE